MSLDARCVESVVTDLTRLRIVVFLYMLCAPWAEIVVYEWARPVVTMELEMSRVEVAITVFTVFCDNFQHLAVAVRT